MAGTSFDNDLSKTRNRESGIVFATDADTSLQDFYWRYNRGLEPYDSSSYEVKVAAGGQEALTAEEKEKYKDRNMYDLLSAIKADL